jgi:hypothetical protein
VKNRDVNISQEHRIIRQSIRIHCKNPLEPIVDAIHREERFPMEFYRSLGREGFLGARAPWEYGGGSLDLNEHLHHQREALPFGCRNSCVRDYLRAQLPSFPLTLKEALFILFHRKSRTS